MTTSIDSLRSLPAKQALLLLLAEKAKREKARKEREAATALAREYASSDGPARPREVTSAVLDRTHPISDLYYKRARYKVYYGGRGALKTWGFGEAAVRIAAERSVRVLCLREYQNSIAQSVRRVVVDQIERLGLSPWFDTRGPVITSRTGSSFHFEGMHGRDQSLRSWEGADIVWVAEAQSVPEPSWRSLIPTIRKDSAEIWVEFNVMEEHDATYQLFVVKPRPNSIVHLVNFDQNPWLPKVLRDELEHDRATDPDLFQHIWMGKPRTRSKAIILSGKYEVRPFDDALAALADRQFRGIDFGFSSDPMAFIGSFILPRHVDPQGRYSLYVQHEAYAHGVELGDETEQFLSSVPDARLWPIKADSSRPETISHIRNMGFAVSAAEKWPGSVEDGIAHLRKFDAIVIHPRCAHTAEEAYLWRYKVDNKQLDEHGMPTVLPIVVDKNNHTWDAVRYSLDGHITKGGVQGLWERLGSAG